VGVTQASFGTTVRDARFVSPLIGLATDPIDRTRALLRTRAPVGDAPFDAFARWPSARCCRWESLHHEIHRPLTSPVACRHPRSAPSAESLSRASFSRACPTYADDLATADSTNECLRTRQKLRPRRLSTTLPEKTHKARAALTPPQWRDDAASTRDAFHHIDWSHAFACDPKCSEFGVEHENTSHTLSFPALAMGRVSAVCHGGLKLVLGLPAPPCSVACSLHVMRTIGFCHLLLQSRALVPRSLSMRSRLAPTDSFGFRLRRPPWKELPPRRTNDRAPSVFTTPWWLRLIDALAFASRSSAGAFSSPAFAIDRIGVVPVAPPEMHRLANRFALAHTPGLRRDRPAAKPVKISPLYDPTRLQSKGALLRLAPCGTRRAWRGTWFPAVRARLAPVVLPPPGLALRPFTATMPCCFVQTRLPRLGPCSRPRIVSMRALLWARRSLSTSATSFQLLRHTST